MVNIRLHGAIWVAVLGAVAGACVSVPAGWCRRYRVGIEAFGVGPCEVGFPNRDQQVLRCSGERYAILRLVDPACWREVVACSKFCLGVNSLVELNILVIECAFVEVTLHFLGAHFWLAPVVWSMAGCTLVFIVEVGRDPRSIYMAVWVLGKLLGNVLP